MLFPFYYDPSTSISAICLFIQAPYLNFRFLCVALGIVYRIYARSYGFAHSVVCTYTNSFPTRSPNLFYLLRL